MRAVVMGAGISGLACAYRLRQKGIPVLLLEQNQRVGGLIHSVETDGFLFELGPQTFLSTDLLLGIIADLGIADDLLRANPRATRYVLVKGRLRPVPLAPPSLLTTSLVGLGTKWRLIRDTCGKSQPPEGDESVADFVRRKFTAELLDNLVAPFASGIYAGDAEKLSLRSAFPAIHRWETEFGSVIRGAMKARPKQGPRHTLCSFKKGVATLVRALGAHLGESLQCGVTVTGLRHTTKDGTPEFKVQTTSRGRNDLISAEAVVLATPAPVAGNLLGPISEAFRTHLVKIEHAPIAVVATGYRREQVAAKLDGFGFLTARKERRRVLGTVWNSSLFPGRTPEGMVLLTSFAGGVTDPAICQLSDAAAADIIVRELAGILRISGPPVATLVRRHPRALPQYNLGYSEILASLDELCARFPGLFLAGNYFQGPSIGACVECAFRTADAVATYLTAGLRDSPGPAI